MSSCKKKIITIDIISDIICPWCYVGKSRLFRAIEMTNGAYDIRTKMRPFQLYPQVPKGGWPKEKFASKKKSGMGSALKEAAAEENLSFNYKDIEMIPNTLEAHRLMHFSATNEQKTNLGMALFVSYFENAEDVENPDVLARLAKECGFTDEMIGRFLNTEEGKEAIEKEVAILKEEGVTAVPSFLLNGQHVIMGVQSVKNWLRYFERVKS